ncbi:MAG: lamin tail domain-containing protein [Bacteroidales bacterium]|nr:lamin tail domain-containing protein [Bacteroidales bacterium]
MKFVCLLVCISIFCNVKAQKKDFLLEDFNNINSWQQDFKNFSNNSENYILDTSTTYSSDYISKQIPKINLNEDSTVWKIEINTNFTNSSANYFEIFLVGNSQNTSDENFNGISIATGIFKPYNSLSLIKYNGENKEQIYCNQKKFTSSVVTVTRSKLGVWRINDEIIYSEEPIMEDLFSEYLIVKFKFNKTGAQKFSFKFTEFYQGSDIQDPEPEQSPQASFSEIVINEIMADISPKPFALPDKKYIELFNNSTIDYNIKNYKLIIGNDSIIFSDITLKSNDYIIISNEKSYSDYGNYFHSQITDKLTIAGKKIILKNADNQIIDS